MFKGILESEAEEPPTLQSPASPTVGPSTVLSQECAARRNTEIQSSAGSEG